MSHGKFVAPLPLFPRCDRVRFYLLGFEHTDPLSNGLWSLIELGEAVGVLHAIRLGKLVKVNLAECKRVIVLELVVFRREVLITWLQNLLVICKRNLSLSAVWHALNGHHATSLPQLADRAAFAFLKGHRASQL